MSFVMELDGGAFVDLLNKAVEKDLEDKLWQKWLTELPRMDKQTFMTFDDYKARHFKKENKKSDEEILQDAKNILKSMSKPK
jgi:hypothetical protein